MFESLGLQGWTPRGASVVLGLLLGLAFGALAQRSRFCLRRSLVGPQDERSSARGTWVMGLASAIAGTGALIATGLVGFEEHRFYARNLPIVAIVGGGLMFGAGMVLTRGCASRLTVLAGSGNLRALIAMLVFAIVAHATLKGVLAPLRVAITGLAVPVGSAVSLAHLPGGAVIWSTLVAAGLTVIAVRSGTRPALLAMGALIGLLVPLGWLGTGFVLHDAFDPIPLDSLAYTSSATDALFWTLASTAVAPTFGLGVFLGTVAGAATAAIAAREFAWTGFTAETPVARYLTGGALMGAGGVLAGGCTVGAGLTGVSTLSVAAILALAAMVAGALGTQSLLDSRMHADALPAE